MAYQKTNFKNLPNTTTPINAENLNKMENAIYDLTTQAKVDGNLIVGGNNTAVLTNGENIVGGYNNNVQSARNIVSGVSNQVSGQESIVSGRENTVASGVLGGSVTGYKHTVSGPYSHTEGYQNENTGNSSHAEGYNNIVSGGQAHAEGNGNIASGGQSHTEGYGNEATKSSTHAEGYKTKATGSQAHSEGWRTVASGGVAHAQNSFTVAAGDSQTAMGRANVEDTTSVLIVGNGSYTKNEDDTYTVNRSNALTLDWEGNLIVSGEVQDGNGNKLSDTTNVEWNQIKTSGTKIAEVTIDGNMTEVYAPTGGGGTSDYTDLENKPSINTVELVGDKTLAELGGRDTFKGTLAEVLAHYNITSLNDLPEGSQTIVTDMGANGSWYGSQEAYDELPDSKNSDGIEYRIFDGVSDYLSAENIKYGNSDVGSVLDDINTNLDKKDYVEDGISEGSIKNIFLNRVRQDGVGYFKISSTFPDYPTSLSSASATIYPILRVYKYSVIGYIEVMGVTSGGTPKFAKGYVTNSGTIIWG